MTSPTDILYASRIAAPFRRALHWVKFGWYKVPEPRVISLLVGISYAIFTLTGVATLTNPPQSLAGEYGATAMQLVGWLFLLGGVTGVIGGTADFWQLERVGVGGMIGGLAFYGGIVLNLHVQNPGSRLTQLGVIVISLLYLLIRLYSIWKYPFKPRR